MNNKKAKQLRKVCKHLYGDDWKKHYRKGKKAYGEVMKERK